MPNFSRPVRTYNTAVVYYHKFRLVHSDNEYDNIVRDLSGARAQLNS